MLDRITSMAVYVKAADLGSFAAAADAMGISPQMVSKHIRFLEDRVGATLIHRTTRRQDLTDTGRAFYERCKVILAETEAAENLATDMHRHPSGLLRVNAPRTFGGLALPPVVSAFLDRYPDVQVELTLDDRFVDPVEEGYDVTIRIGAPANAGLSSVPLGFYHLIACAAPAYLARHGYPETPEKLSEHQCLIFGQRAGNTLCHWTFARDGRSHETRVDGRLFSNDWRVLMHAALEGRAIAFGAEAILREELKAGRLVRLFEDYETPKRPVHALYLAGRKPAARVRRFVESLEAAFAPKA